MTYYTNEGKTYCVVGTAEGTVTSASGVVIASFSANEQSYFTAPAGGFVTISDETAIVTPVFKLAPSALVGESSGGDSPTPSPTPTPSGDYSDYIGYIEYDDETGAIVDLSIPKYLTKNPYFKNGDLPENYDWKFDMPYLTDGDSMFDSCGNLSSFEGDLSALTNGNSMFSGCSNLTSFDGDLSSLSDGSYMFNDCKNLRSFTSDLSSLNSGGGMFFGCKLDAASVECILTTIPTYTDGSTRNFALHCSSEGAAKFEEITGVTIPTFFLPKQVSYKGWKIMAKINNA